jgi:hypothetical protein
MLGVETTGTPESGPGRSLATHRLLARLELPRQDAGMKFGIAFANTAFYASTAGAIALAQGAEAVGVDSLWTVEHVVVPVGYESPYPYSSTGKMPADATTTTCPIPSFG